MTTIKDLKRIIEDVERCYQFTNSKFYQSADEVPVILEIDDGLGSNKHYECNAVHGLTDITNGQIAIALSPADITGNPIKGIFKEHIIEEVDSKEATIEYIDKYMIKNNCRFIQVIGVDPMNRSISEAETTVKLIFEKIEED